MITYKEALIYALKKLTWQVDNGFRQKFTDEDVVEETNRIYSLTNESMASIQ